MEIPPTTPLETVVKEYSQKQLYNSYSIFKYDEKPPW